MRYWARFRAAGKRYHAALGGRVRRLADLAVLRRDRGGVDHDAALAVLERLGGGDLLSGQCHDVERAEEVGLDGLSLDPPRVGSGRSFLAPGQVRQGGVRERHPHHVTTDHAASGRAGGSSSWSVSSVASMAAVSESADM